MFDLNFYKGKKVFVTGHTGFKGSWLCKILTNAGAIVTGYSLKPTTNPSLFDIAGISKDINSVIGDIRDYNVEIKVATVGKNPGGSFTLIKGSNVENNTVTIGEYWPRAIKGWDSSELKDIFVGTDSSVNNKLRLGILDYRPDPYNEGNPPKTVVTSIDVGIGNDIELVGGKADGLTADYKGISFVGRNLTLSDADGTEQIKSANMQGTVTATRALNVTEDLIASGDITANGGLTAGGNIKGANISTASHALKGNVITANGDITSGTLDANDVYAKSITASGNINVTGVIKLINANAKARAVAGDIIGNSITASSIVANNVTAGVRI